MNRILSVTLAAVLLSGLCLSRADAAGGLYLGAGLGQSTIKDSGLDASDTGYKALFRSSTWPSKAATPTSASPRSRTCSSSCTAMTPRAC